MKKAMKRGALAPESYPRMNHPRGMHEYFLIGYGNQKKLWAKNRDYSSSSRP
jgi:hypothetical protein